MTQHPFKLVQVEWEDSTQPVAVWQKLADYVVPDTITCLSVGFLIADTPAAIALAPNLGAVTGGVPEASGIIRIPRGAILRISYLRKPRVGPEPIKEQFTPEELAIGKLAFGTAFGEEKSN